VSVECAHCKLPASETDDGRPSFCCPGCEQAFAILKDIGLEEYYPLRDRLGGGAQGLSRPRSAASGTYAHLDDPQLQAQLGNDPGEAEVVVEDLHCMACVWLLERLPDAVDGLNHIRVRFSDGTLALRWDPEKIHLSEIAGLLSGLGYPPSAIDGRGAQKIRLRGRRTIIRLAVSGASAGNVMLLAISLYAGSFSGMQLEMENFLGWASLVLAAPALTYGAYPFYRSSIRGLKMGQLHIDLPISVGLFGGTAASVVATVTGHGDIYYDSLCVLVFLLLVGRYVQTKGQRWALSETNILGLLIPGDALQVGQGGELLPTAADRLQAGDEVEVTKGGTIPVDGVVTRGRSAIDASSLTGESSPLSVSPGMTVLAGTINVGSQIRVKVEAAGRNTRIGALARKIMETDAPPPIQRFADRVSRVFVMAVLALAGVAGGVWWMVDSSRAFPVVVSLLVISCPCALGLATPVALSIVRARAIRRGFLMPSAATIEHVAATKKIVFDKTGTLTLGTMEVIWNRGFDEHVAQVVAEIERRSEHPVGRAVRSIVDGFDIAATGSKVESYVVEDLCDHPGQGISAVCGGQSWRVGSTAWIGGGDSFSVEIERALESGKTPVLVELEGRTIAMAALGDRLRPGALEAIHDLRSMGYEISICSGDHPRVVSAIAGGLGIDHARGHMSAEDKAAYVRAAGCIMVGDGINDAPALRAAKVGVALRGGAEVALEVADVHLTSGGMTSVVELVRGCRRGVTIVRRNLVFSLIYNVLFAALAVAGMINPLAAAIIMPASSLTLLFASVVAKSFSRSAPLKARV